MDNFLSRGLAIVPEILVFEFREKSRSILRPVHPFSECWQHSHSARWFNALINVSAAINDRE
jgi:hypothetical protein